MPEQVKKKKYFRTYCISGLDINGMTHKGLKMCVKNLIEQAVVDNDFQFKQHVSIKTGFK